eukprot:s512_g26.t1
MARNVEEPEPEQFDDAEQLVEVDDELPAVVQRLSRYPIGERSLRNRCELRVNRGVNEAKNAVRRDLLSAMLRECQRGLHGDRYANMTENVISMTDLSEDETSPTHALKQEQVWQMTLQCQQAFEMALQEAIRARNAATAATSASTDASAEIPADEGEESEHQTDSDPSETGVEKLERYMAASLEEVSDPEYWTELHYGDD